MARLSVADIEAFLAQHFPAASGFGRIEHLAENELRVRLAFDPRFLRPGGRVSGPTLMMLADTAAYYLVLSHLDAIRDTFTSNLEIHFLRPAAPRDIVANARLLKMGKRLAVCAIEMCNADDPAVVAHATVTYAIPSA